MSDDLSPRIEGVELGPETVNAQYLTIHTTRGSIPMMLHPAAQPGRAVLCISGAIGGFDGPANLYVRLGETMPARGIGVARINYRHPNDFGECVLDALAGLSFLKGYRYPRVAILGHSFGGAVAINAGTLNPTATTVVALSSQLAGAHVVADLAPKPLLLIHGTADTILSHQSSEMLFERAGESKTLKLFAGAGHSLKEVGDELAELVIDWLVANI